MSNPQPGRPAEAYIEGDWLMVRVELSALPIALPVAWERRWGEDTCPPVVDLSVFADDVVRELNREDDEGTTPIHMMLDEAMREAVEQGSLGIGDVPVTKSDEMEADHA